MAMFAHIAFARNIAGEMVAARELFELAPAGYACAGCGKAVRLQFARKGLSYFTHVVGPDCPLGAQRALRAATLQLLAELRAIQTPPLHGSQTKSTGKKALPVLLEEWDCGTANVRIDDVTVDFLAETLAGKLGIQLALPGLTDLNRREQLQGLGIPILEVILAKPGDIRTFADIRSRILEDTQNKRWLTHPALEPETPAFASTPLEEKLGWTAVAQPLSGSEPSPSKTTAPLPPRQGTTGAHPHLVFRQLSVSKKIEIIETRMGCSQRKWPSLVDTHVTGENAFGCDRQVWQADVYSRFVYEAIRQHRAAPFSSENVLSWLEARYEIQPPFPNAERIALYYYLEHLSREGCLVGLGRQRYRPILPRVQTGAQAQWDPSASLSVSRFLNAARSCHLTIPYDEIEWILASFQDGPPNEPVGAFVTAVAQRLHAQPRAVMTVLEKAGLLRSTPDSPRASGDTSSQGQLF